MSAQNYDVTFGYGAKDGKYYGTNGSIGLYHKGNDRSTPVGTPIDIGGTTIGLTGKSGAVSSAHLHTQAGTDLACQNTFDPTPIEFKPGTVVATGFGNQWGNYITLQVGDKYITYAHLSRIDVKVGQKIGGIIVNPTRPQIARIWLLSLFADLNQVDAQTRENVLSYYEQRPLDVLLGEISNSAGRQLVVDKFLKGVNPTEINKASVIDFISKNLK